MEFGELELAFANGVTVKLRVYESGLVTWGAAIPLSMHIRQRQAIMNRLVRHELISAQATQIQTSDSIVVNAVAENTGLALLLMAILAGSKQP